MSQRLANSDPQAAVERGRNALDASFWGYPWYDSANDGIRRIDVQPPQTRSSQWGNSDLSWLMWVAWVLLALLLAGLAYVLFRALFQADIPIGDGSGHRQRRGGQSDLDRIEALPVPINRSQDDLLGEARRCYDRGDYNEAIVYLFSYQLVELDKHQHLRLAKGKTNREYLREVGPRRPLGGLLERSMVAFEDVFFGQHVLGRERFESCWNQLDGFHQLLGQAA